MWAPGVGMYTSDGGVETLGGLGMGVEYEY